MRRFATWPAVSLTLGWLLIGAGAVAAESEAARSDAAESETHRNRLADESSPYLLLHAGNPVDWYPWGEEALAAARKRGVPIFLSVGYSTCYWCHVMEREVFSDRRIAAEMNRRFVNIKVDREERPELDEIYLTATQLMTQSGGWPNSVFLTPDLAPFFAGTYFPPAQFATILARVDEAWTRDRAGVEAQARRVAEALRASLGASPAGAAEAAKDADANDLARRAVRGLGRRFDPDWGGFAGPPRHAPKFPQPSTLLFLLDPVVLDALEAPQRARAETMASETLDRIGHSGLYDVLDGGFHRYTVDREWRVPHFEKMLYDNGALLEVYARAPSANEEILRETAAFLARELTSPSGAFHSALDAEADGVEGSHVTWTQAQLRAALDDGSFRFAAPLLGFDGPPFFADPHAKTEGAAKEPDAWVLHRPVDLDAAAASRDMSRTELVARLAAIRRTLFAARGERPGPRLDDKILTDWNGLAIAGLAAAGRALGDEALVGQALIDQAVRAADDVWAKLGPTETLETLETSQPLRHVWRAADAADEADAEKTVARLDAYLADYAYLLHGLLALHQATGDEKWLRRAETVADEMVERLWDDEDGGFFSAGTDASLLVRAKDVSDGARPSPNGMAILGLVELGVLTRDASRIERAGRAVRAFAGLVDRAPDAYPTLVRAALHQRAAAEVAASWDDAPGSFRDSN